jgi:hypothetical protein
MIAILGALLLIDEGCPGKRGQLRSVKDCENVSSNVALSGSEPAMTEQLGGLREIR